MGHSQYNTLILRDLIGGWCGENCNKNESSQSSNGLGSNIRYIKRRSYVQRERGFQYTLLRNIHCCGRRVCFDSLKRHNDFLRTFLKVVGLQTVKENTTSYSIE